MEFRNLKEQYNNHKSIIDNAISNVISAANYIGGEEVSRIEKNLADYVGMKYCISCGNGTDALLLALMVWNVGPGDAVFVPDFTFFSTGEVVANLGATPVFVDVDANTYTMSSKKLDNAIKYVVEKTELRPKVVVPVDLFGLPANYDEIKKITEKYGLLVLEDAAQGFGGRISEKKACSFGDISTTSFFPAKPLGCYGDGGAIFTDNDMWAELLRSYKVHGKGTDKYDNVRIGMNSRLDTLQAAILIEKLSFFDEEIDKCNEVAQQYDRLLSSISGVKIPKIPVGYFSSWAQYTILLPTEECRSQVIKALEVRGVPAMIYYKKPMHRQRAFDIVQVGKTVYGDGANVDMELSCPITEDICKRCLSLPMSAYVKEEDIKYISGIIEEVVR